MSLGMLCQESTRCAHQYVGEYFSACPPQTYSLDAAQNIFNLQVCGEGQHMEGDSVVPTASAMLEVMPHICMTSPAQISLPISNDPGMLQRGNHPPPAP